MKSSNEGKRETILLVDDEEDILTLGQRMLDRLGYSAVVAANGREAITQYQENREHIACVLLDLTMQPMDGERTLIELRKIDPEVVIIMSSGNDINDVRRRFAGHNLNGVIPKPYRLRTLREKFDEVLSEVGSSS